MENKKICIHCNLEKFIDEFPKYKNRYGEFLYRNVCRTCFNIQTRKTKSDKIYAPRIKPEIPTEYKIERGIYDMLTEKEIEKLKLLANRADDIINNLENKIKVQSEIDKAGRIVRSINFNTSIYDKLQQYSKKNGISISDIVNNVLSKSLESLE